MDSNLNSEMRSKLRVLVFYTTGLPRNGSQTSGGETRLLEILNRIDEDVDLTCITTTKDGDYLLNNGVKSNYVRLINGYKWMGVLLIYLLRTIQGIVYVVKNNQAYDICYSSSDFYPDVIPAYCFSKFGGRWVQVIHHIYTHWKDREGKLFINIGGYYLQLLSFIFIRKKANNIILVNTKTEKYLLKLGFDKSKLVVSSNGIDLNYFSSIKTTPSNDNYEASYMGRIIHTKGVFDLVDVWEIVQKEIPDARLVIIGGGEESIIHELKVYIDEKGLSEFVIITGFLQKDAAFKNIKNSKCFLFPSHEEGWGISIAEAMACNIPVVAWDLPVYYELFDSALIMIKEYDINAFSQAVIVLLKDNEINSKIAEESSLCVRNRDKNWDYIANKEKNIIGVI
jgi:glycosyltransferase involved in cell wall biosynthesis